MLDDKIIWDLIYSWVGHNKKIINLITSKYSWLIGKNATYLPGLIALKLDKNFLCGLQKPETLICVTGTNGKTTTSNMITDILRDNGYSVTNNGFGSNVQAGVATALLADATLTGKPKNKIENKRLSYW